MSTIRLAAAAFTVAFAVAAGPGDAQDAAEAAKEEKKICRTEKATGSLTRRTRICMTAAQWREFHSRTKKGVDEMQNSASGAPTCISAIDVSCTPAAAAPSAGIAPGSF